MADETTTDTDNIVVKRMMRNWKLSSEAERENRERGLKALKFRRGGEDQWDKAVYDMFGGLNKPRDSFNQIPQFIHQVTNDMRMNMPQIRFTAGDDGDGKVAEIIEDKCREIQATSEAEVAYDTATDSQVTIGWGYWKFITKYADNKTNHKDIGIEWIPNAFKVYDDPNASMQDFSDRTFLIEITDEPIRAFNKTYKRDYKAKDYAQELRSIGDDTQEWCNETNDTVRTALYWEAENNKKTVYYDDAGNQTETKTENSRDIDDFTVTCYKCTAKEVLETYKWDGIYIPYVRVSGETLYIDGKVLYLGLVDAMIPVQKQFNYFMNSASYKTTLPPIAPYVLDPVQVEGYEEYWQRMNTDPTPYVPARRYVDGKDYGYPPRADNSVELQSDMAMIQQCQQNFYNTTGIYPASLGQESNEKSGKAIIARQKEGDVSTFHFQDNNARALRFGGRVFEDLFKKTYDGSRTITAMKEDRTKYQVKINQETDDDVGGKAYHDTTKGSYMVAVTTGPSYTTKKAEAADQAAQLIQSFPQIMQTPAGPELIRSMDLVQADMIADGLERALPPQFQTPPELKDLPDNVKPIIMQGMAQIQQLTEQNQQLQQILQQGQQELQQAQQAAQDKSADSQFKMIDSQSKAADAQRKHDYDMLNLQLQMTKLQQDGQFREAELALQDKQLTIQAFSAGLKFDQAQAVLDQAVIDRAVDQAHDLNMQEVDHGHQANMAVLQAGLTPTPEPQASDAENA